MTKYFLTRVGKHIFRISAAEEYDRIFGNGIYYTIAETDYIPKTWYQRLYSFWKFPEITSGLWWGFDIDTFEQRYLAEIQMYLNDCDNDKKVEKTFADL